MFKKGMIMLILACMVLHCASRVGFLSYLYQQRDKIAFSLGMIAEVPIAMCSSNYDFGDDLVIHAPHDDEAARQTLAVALEIKLFFVAIEIPISPIKEGDSHKGNTFFWSLPLNGCLRSIFHPPAHHA